MSLAIASPVLCSKDAQAGQRMSSKTSRVSLAFLSPIRISVPFLPWVWAGATGLASLAASQPVGSLAFSTMKPMPPATARTPTTAPATTS